MPTYKSSMKMRLCNIIRKIADKANRRDGWDFGDVFFGGIRRENIFPYFEYVFTDTEMDKNCVPDGLIRHFEYYYKTLTPKKSGNIFTISHNRQPYIFSAEKIDEYWSYCIYCMKNIKLEPISAYVLPVLEGFEDISTKRIPLVTDFTSVTQYGQYIISPVDNDTEDIGDSITKVIASIDIIRNNYKKVDNIENKKMKKIINHILQDKIVKYDDVNYVQKCLSLYKNFLEELHRRLYE